MPWYLFKPKDNFTLRTLRSTGDIPQVMSVIRVDVEP